MVPKLNMLVLSSNVMVPNASVDCSYQSEKITDEPPLYNFV